MARANKGSKDRKGRPKTKAATRRNPYHWHRRIVKEMKQNPGVVDKVVDGKLDYIFS
jgi:hypothetical protein